VIRKRKRAEVSALLAKRQNLGSLVPYTPASPGLIEGRKVEKAERWPIVTWIVD
jgi:hypothetical protein